MQVIVATDIFGYTKYIDSLISMLASCEIQAEIIDPYNKEERFFSDKEHAYASFTQECGHEKYAQHLLSTLTNNKKPTTVLGFSAGASAAWRAAGGYTSKNLAQIIGFYPTQVRKYLDISVSAPTTLIFPNTETHFEVKKIISVVSQRDNVQCIHTHYEHGFMNPLSSGFSETGFEIFCKWLQSALTPQ